MAFFNSFFTHFQRELFFTGDISKHFANYIFQKIYGFSMHFADPK